VTAAPDPLASTSRPPHRADRRLLLLGSLAAAVLGGCAGTLAPHEAADVDRLGSFELVPGQPGIVVGVPHGTPDVGTTEVGRILCERLGAGGVLVTGFWDSRTRERINVNRPTEEVIGEHSEALRQWASPRAARVNARYQALVEQAAQGPLRRFYEIHSNHNPRFVGSIEVSTLGVSRNEALRLKDAFGASIDKLDPEIPRLVMHVEPVDRVTYSYERSSSLARVAAKGCLIESPGHVFQRSPWRRAYAEHLAGAITAVWG
jgi:hypothetical protein